MNRHLRPTLLFVCVLLAVPACSNEPVAVPADSGSPPDASCAYPCGKACCTKTQSCDFEALACVDKCEPDCFGRSCGSDGCGAACGYCDPGTVCNEGTGKCVVCSKDCINKQCGPDGCGGSCGACNSGFTCTAAQCVASPADAGVAGTDASSGPDGAQPSADASVPDAGSAGADAATSDGGAGPTDAGSTDGGSQAFDASVPDAAVYVGDAGPICIPQAPTYNPSFTAAQYCDQWSRVICDRLSKCCLLSTATYADCLAYKYKECDTQDVTARIQAGTVTVDMTAAKACFDAERARATCDGNAYVMILPACDMERILVGAAAPAAKCYRDLDCASGWCVRTASTCDGVCHGYQALAATCNNVDLRCNPKTSVCKGSPATCQALVPTNGACTTTSNCLPTDYCPAGTCVARLGMGAVCSDASQCQDPLTCIAGYCREDYSVPSGGPCLAANDCSPGTWCKGASAGVPGVCTTYTTLGQTCLGTSTVECGPDAFCSTGLQCTARLPMFASCTTGGQCQSGLVCTSSVCVRQGELGDPCTSDGQCRRYLRCNGTTCTDALAPLAAACSQTPHCDNAFCPSATNVCTAFNADGATCTSDVSCASGNCETNTSLVKACRPKCTY